MRLGLSLLRRRLIASMGAPLGAPPYTLVLREDVHLAAAAIYHPSAPTFRYDIAAALAAGDGSITTSDESLAHALTEWARDETGQPILIALA